MENSLSFIIFLGFLFWGISYLKARKQNTKTSKTTKYIGWITLILFIIFVLIPSPKKENQNTSSNTISSSVAISSENNKKESTNTSSNEKKPNSKSNNEKLSEDPEKLKSFAKTFGRKSVDELQQKDYVYKSTQIDSGTMYSWNTGYNVILLRFDNDSDGTTIVYTLDDNNNRNILWSGKTITQRTKVTRVFY